MAREMQCAKESTDSRDESTYLNDAIADDETRDCCAHSKTERDDARDTAESIYFGQDEIHWQHAAADKAEYHAYTAAKHAKCCPHMTDGLSHKGRRHTLSSLVNEPVACIAYQPQYCP